MTEEEEKLKAMQDAGQMATREFKAASEIGAKRGITDKKGKEYGPITKLFMGPIKKIQKYIVLIGGFVSKMWKLFISVLKLALKAMIYGMLYLAVIVGAFILLKPVAVKVWDLFKKSSGQFGTMREHFASFMETWNTTLKPLFMTAWESMKGFFAVLSDPNATIGSALSAGATMVMDLATAWIALAKAWISEMIIPLLTILYHTAIALWEGFKTWVSDTLWPYLIEKVPIWLAIIEEKLIWLKDYLADHVPIWARAVWDWLITTGLPAFAEGMIAIAVWVMDEFFPRLARFIIWVNDKVIPFVIEKVGAFLTWFVVDFIIGWLLPAVGNFFLPLFMTLGEWFVETMGGWVYNNLFLPLFNLIDAFVNVGDNLKEGFTDTFGTNLNPFDGKADGGLITKTAPYLVGERGPEIVQLNAGNNVVPNHKLGGTNVINVSVNGRVGASDSELRDIARKVGSMINREINRTTNAGVRL